MFLSLEKIMLMLPVTGQSRDSFRQQVQQAVEEFCLQYAQHADFVKYIQDHYAHKIGGQHLLWHSQMPACLILSCQTNAALLAL